MPSENNTIENLRTEKEKTEKELSKLRDNYYILGEENRNLQAEIRTLEREKEKLMDIVENLSKGYANMQNN